MIITEKTCTKCLVTKPISEFGKHRRNKDGLECQCKTCINRYNRKSRRLRTDERRVEMSEYHRRYRENNREALSHQRRQHYLENRNEILRRQKELRHDNSDQFRKQKRQYYYNNRERILGQTKAYRDKPESKQKHMVKQRQYRIDTPELSRERNKRYRENHPEKNRERGRIDRQLNRDRYRHYCALRHTRKKGLVCDFTCTYWLYCLDYFNNSCAYCGKTGVVLHREHVIPLTKGGGYTKGNIIPSCRSCNSSKSNKDFLFWFRSYKHYNIKREEFILEYLKSLNDEAGIEQQLTKPQQEVIRAIRYGKGN